VEFSRSVRNVASEKCAKPSTTVHMPYTTFPQAPEMCKPRQKFENSREILTNKKYSADTFAQKTGTPP
jgi:hypothetical protein